MGVGNDGGSAAIPEGLLQNTDASAGYPLFERDGLVPLNGGSALPPTFNVQGDDPTHALKDSTLVNEFVSDSIHIGCSTPGTIGPTAENRVLIAQITTAGDLTLEFNVEVEHADGTTARYMARDTLLAPDETANGLLVYPPSCGCTDPNFLEYDPAAGCDDGSCATTIVFGCLDPTACNYDPNANFNVNELCCYGPTDCNGLDVTIVCPDVSVNDPYAMPTITVGPVPTSSTVDIRISGSGAVRLRSSLSDALGRTVLQVDHGTVNGSAPQVLHMEQLPAGIYHLHLDADGRRIQRTICKY